MTIKELEKLYPPKKCRWLALKDNYPNWNYKDDDIVVEYYVKENSKSVDITDCLFKKNGKAKITYDTIVQVYWRKA